MRRKLPRFLSRWLLTNGVQADTDQCNDPPRGSFLDTRPLLATDGQAGPGPGNSAWYADGLRGRGPLVVCCASQRDQRASGGGHGLPSDDVRPAS